MSPLFDLVIVGTGVAGRTAIDEAVAAGLRTAVVDERPYGGTCALRGCEPKKVLFAAAEVVRRARGQKGHGPSGDLRLDWAELVAYEHTFTDGLPESFEHTFSEEGVVTLHGTARFTGEDTIDIDGEELTFLHALVASGAVPIPLGIPGAELVVDSEAFMSLPSMPERVVFIGGGYVSFELAGIARATGAHPVILHRSARPLKEFDADLVDRLVAQYADDGIEVRVNAPVSAVERNGDVLSVVCGDGARRDADLVVHGAGRGPDLSRLELDAAGVRAGRHGVEVNETMRSVTNSRVFAAGDAAAVGPPLTPVGILQARVAVANILEPGSIRYAPPVVSSVCFSQPPIASVGMTAADAEGRDDIMVKLTDTSGWASTKRAGLSHGGVKTLLDRRTGRLLGAHVLGEHADELVNVFALAIASGSTDEQLKGLLWAYPTAASEIVYEL
jgi:glutathione reductase (NADPH)